jgi:hypothetical protein
MKKPKITAVRIGLNKRNNSKSYLLMKGTDFQAQDTVNVSYPANSSSPSVTWTGTATTFSNGGATYLYVCLTATNPGTAAALRSPESMDDVSVTATNSDGTSEPFTLNAELYDQPSTP